jgi:hypothetical protein
MRFSRIFIVLAGLSLGSAWAAPVLELPGETLLAQSAELRARLNLSASQTGVWLQLESRTRIMLAERRARRERLQMDMEADLARDRGNLADLASRIDADESQMLDEDRSLRQSWLQVFESLDASQRQAVAEALHKQLEVQAPQCPTPARPTDDTPRREGRGGRGSRGAGGGMGGMGGGTIGF